MTYPVTGADFGVHGGSKTSWRWCWNRICACVLRPDWLLAQTAEIWRRRFYSSLPNRAEKAQSGTAGRLNKAETLEPLSTAWSFENKTICCYYVEATLWIKVDIWETINSFYSFEKLKAEKSWERVCVGGCLSAEQSACAALLSFSRSESQ